jgi:uncharacterized membrane protein
MSDKPKVQFFLSTAIGGVLFLLPVVIMGVVLFKAAGIMMIVATPMADFIPVDSIGGVALANILALLLVILLCFLAGLVARHALAGKVVGQLESKVLVNVPVSKIIEITENFGYGAEQLLSAQREKSNA